MSDIALSLGITVLLLAGLAAWVPLLHLAARVAKRNERHTRVGARELPQGRERAPEPEVSFEREIVQ